MGIGGRLWRHPIQIHKCYEHGHLFRDCPLNKREDNLKNNIGKDPKGFTKLGGRGKGGGKNQKKPSERKLPSHSSFNILEEEVGENRKNKEWKDIHTEEEKEDSMDIR